MFVGRTSWVQETAWQQPCAVRSIQRAGAASFAFSWVLGLACLLSREAAAFALFLPLEAGRRRERYGGSLSGEALHAGWMPGGVWERALAASTTSPWMLMAQHTPLWPAGAPESRRQLGHRALAALPASARPPIDAVEPLVTRRRSP
jgi:hypothetical protein